METDTTVPVIIFQTLFLIFLVLINALLASLKISVNKLKTNTSSDDEIENNKTVNKIIDNSDEYIIALSLIKLFITITASIYSSKNIMILLEIQFSKMNLPYAQNLSMFIMALIIAYLMLSFGKMIPKKMALFKDKKPKNSAIKLIRLAYLITFPLTKLIFFTNTMVLKILNPNSKDFDEKVSAEEIKALVETASEKGVFNDIEKEIINSIFSFDDITAKDIMVSRKDTYKIDINQPIQNYLDEIIESYYSRIPVYKENIDDIIGILNTKDLLSEARKVGFENIDIEKLLQKPYFVPEMKSIDELFKEMQRLRNHMAILVDEYGGFSGIVTIEDLIEQIMGDINDEFDDEENNIIQIGENKYSISGTTEIREINKELNLNLENENYDTISALIIEKLGYIPNNDEKPIVNIDNLSFEVELASENRIQKVNLTINQLEEETVKA